MRKLLLISGNLSLRMAVSGDYEIVEERPSRGWRFDPASIQSVDAVLLDLHNEETTSQVLDEILATAFTGPVLVCAVAGEDWSHVAEGAPDRIAVVELPVSGAALSAALDRLMPSGRAARFGSRRTDERHTDSVPAAAEPLDEPVPAPKVEAATPRPAKPPAASAPRPTPAAAAVAPRPAVPLPAQRGDLYDHVRGLAANISGLRGLEAVAEELVDAAVDATSSEAGAVLVPDSSYWRVAAGVGVRHVEWRLAVASDAWLIEETIAQRHGIVVEGTDIARQRLSGVPLASWEHLMVAPISDVDVVVLVAREAGAYSDDDIRDLTKVGEGFTSKLDDAIALRELARSLQQFADADLQDEAR